MPEAVGKVDIGMPLEGLLVDYVYVFKQRGAWRSWNDITKRLEVEETSLGVQVPTVDTARYMHLLKMHIEVRHFPIYHIWLKYLSFCNRTRRKFYWWVQREQAKVFISKII